MAQYKGGGNMRYLVKVTYKAKENNPNFAGKTEVYYFGKDGHALGYVPPLWFIGRYGYTRKCDALKNFHFKSADDEIYWYKNVEVVEMA